ncbi:MAG: hypothetical protein HUU21_36575, partial [Polyangiaceae bacterium]|nr:hypothetical protein [Polyangiaceae bacterium]
MSDDPKRWSLDGAGSTREEREILRAAAGVDVDPPPGSEKAVWAALALHVGGAGGAGG